MATRALAQGTVVAWLSAQPRDEPDRLAQCLALSVRMASGRQTFCHTLLEAAAPGGLEGITIWLAELARAAFNAVLFVDEADNLPEASREALVYLLRNAPANLRCVIAARPDFRLDIEDLVTYGQCIEVGPTMLRFRLEESLELAHVQLNARIDNDTAARLHELTEGWPLGLQLALSAISAGAEPRAAVSGMAGRLGELREHLVGVLLSNLDAADVDFLARISILEDLHPDLCRSLSGDDDAPARLARLGRDTPVFVVGEHSEWMRMSVLARETLRQRFTALPAAMQGHAHARAAAWLDEHGLLEPAARHALAAGLHDKAYELAERSLYESIMKRGRQSTVLGWVADLPDQELDRRPACCWRLPGRSRSASVTRKLAAWWSVCWRSRAPTMRCAAKARSSWAARRSSRTSLTASPSCTTLGDRIRRCTTPCCLTCTPTGRPTERCSRVIRRWRACASSRRRTETSGMRSSTSTAGGAHHRAHLPVGRAGAARRESAAPGPGERRG